MVAKVIFSDSSAGSRPRGQMRPRVRRGSATLDYILVLCVVLPLAAFLFWIGPRIIHSVYDLFTVIVAGPFA